MNLQPDTISLQSNLHAYVRGNKISLNGVNKNGIKTYRRLVYSIFSEHLESVFPILRSSLSQTKWDKMVKEFLLNNPCRTHQVWQLGFEFYAYSQTHKYSELFKINYLNDLMLFEWTETKLYNMPDLTVPAYLSHGDILNDQLIFCPEFELLNLHYPVHEHHPKSKQFKERACFLLLYRESETGNIQFLELSPWYALIIEQLSNASLSLSELIMEVPKLFGKLPDEQFVKTTLDFLHQLKEKKFLLGSKQ